MKRHDFTLHDEQVRKRRPEYASYPCLPDFRIDCKADETFAKYALSDTVRVCRLWFNGKHFRFSDFDFSKLQGLDTLILIGEMPDFPPSVVDVLRHVDSLRIHDMEKVETLPPSSVMPACKGVVLQTIKNTALPPCDTLAVDRIIVGDCNNLESIDSLAGLASTLTRVLLHDLPKLKNLHPLRDLRIMGTLTIDDCPLVTDDHLQEVLRSHPKLPSLTLKNLPGLRTLDLTMLKEVAFLRIKHCNMLERILLPTLASDQHTVSIQKCRRLRHVTSTSTPPRAGWFYHCPNLDAHNLVPMTHRERINNSDYDSYFDESE